MKLDSESSLVPEIFPKRVVLIFHPVLYIEASMVSGSRSEPPPPTSADFLSDSGWENRKEIKGAGRASGPQSVFPQNLQISSVRFPYKSLEKI